MTVFGSVLLHLRDPFLALQEALAITTQTAIIVEPAWCGRPFGGICRALERASGFGGRWLARFTKLRSRLLPGLDTTFKPRFDICEPIDTWWDLSPSFLRAAIQVLGFENVRIGYHYQRHRSMGYTPYCTVVGCRPPGQGGIVEG